MSVVTPSVQQRRLEFAQRLREHVPVGSVRQTARLLDPEDPERGRRNLNRWLKAKVLPSAKSRIALAEALGLKADHFLDAEDDEEEALNLVARLHEIRRGHAALARQLDEIFRAVRA